MLISRLFAKLFKVPFVSFASSSACNFATIFGIAPPIARAIVARRTARTWFTARLCLQPLHFAWHSQHHIRRSLFQRTSYQALASVSPFTTYETSLVTLSVP